MHGEATMQACRFASRAAVLRRRRGARMDAVATMDASNVSWFGQSGRKTEELLLVIASEGYGRLARETARFSAASDRPTRSDNDRFRRLRPLPHTVLSYQNAAGGALHPAAQGLLPATS